MKCPKQPTLDRFHNEINAKPLTRAAERMRAERR
jgi:hypothetical protein